MSNQLIPFGKYKGQPIEAIQDDRQYIDWLLAQSWFKDRHKEFYTIIINNFQEDADTPQHNAMHVKFLNDDYVLEVLSKCQGDLKDYVVNHKKFEVAGWDVVVEITNKCGDLWERHEEIEARIKDLEAHKRDLQSKTPRYLFTDQTASSDKSGWRDEINNQILAVDDAVAELKNKRSYIDFNRYHFCIEIKPTVSDDFPSILRQIKSAKSNYCVYGSIVILLVGEYTGIGASKDEFVSFMENEHVTVIFDNQQA